MTIQLQLRPKPTVKKKYKTHNPINFAISKQDKDKIKYLSELTLKALAAGTGNSTDWYNATFRTMHCVEIAKIDYADETVAEVKEILDIFLKKEEQYAENPEWYKFTAEEVELFKLIHDAMCDMFETTTRRTQLEAILITDKYMKRYLKKGW